ALWMKVERAESRQQNAVKTSEEQSSPLSPVIPATCGDPCSGCVTWVPACAGMTSSRRFSLLSAFCPLLSPLRPHPCHLGSLLHALRPDAEAAPFELTGGTNLVGETEAVGPVFFTGAPGAVPGEVE